MKYIRLCKIEYIIMYFITQRTLWWTICKVDEHSQKLQLGVPFIILSDIFLQIKFPKSEVVTEITSRAWNSRLHPVTLGQACTCVPVSL